MTSTRRTPTESKLSSRAANWQAGAAPYTQHPGYMLVRRDGRLVAEKAEQQSDQSARPAPTAEKKPPTPSSTDQVRAQITGMIRKELPALTEAYNHGLEKEADKQAMKK